jgi:hypothetical protein
MTTLAAKQNASNGRLGGWRFLTSGIQNAKNPLAFRQAGHATAAASLQVEVMKPINPCRHRGHVALVEVGDNFKFSIRKDQGLVWQVQSFQACLERLDSFTRLGFRLALCFQQSNERPKLDPTQLLSLHHAIMPVLPRRIPLGFTVASGGIARNVKNIARSTISATFIYTKKPALAGGLRCFFA